MSAPTPRTDAEWNNATAAHEKMVVKEANARIRIAQLERELEEAQCKAVMLEAGKYGVRHLGARIMDLESQLTAHKAALVKASEVWFGHTLACSINRLQSGMKCTCNLDTRRDEALTAINEVLEEKK